MAASPFTTTVSVLVGVFSSVLGLGGDAASVMLAVEEGDNDAADEDEGGSFVGSEGFFG